MMIDDGLRKLALCKYPAQRSGWDRVEFRSRNAAADALSRLRRWDSSSVFKMRSLVALYAPTGCFQLSDDAVAELAATLLYSGQLVLMAEPQAGAYGSVRIVESTGRGAEFPLSERTPQRAVFSKAAIAPDPPTFPPELQSDAQALALTLAAQKGVPFCPI